MSETPAEQAVAQPSSRGRAVTAVILLVLAALLTTPAGIAYWGQRTLNDADRYLETVAPLVDSPEVQDAIATKVTQAIQQQVDVEALLDQAFAGVIEQRPRLDLLVGPLAGAVNGLIESQVREFIASDTFESLWIAANVRSQDLMHRLLTGQPTGAVSIQGDQVVLDVSEVIEAVKQRLVDRGLSIAANVPVPDQDRVIVLMDSPQLKQVRTIYAFSNPIAQWLIVVVALFYLGAFLLARRRPRMAVAIGLVLAVNALLVALMLTVGRQLFVNELSGTVFGPASTVFYDTLLSFLERGRKVMLWLGLIIVAAGWFAGRNASGAATRTAVVGVLDSAGSSLADTPVAGVGRWVGANIRWLRVVAGLVGVVVLLWGNDTSVTRLAWSTLLVVALLVIAQVLAAAGGASARPETDAAEAAA